MEQLTTEHAFLRRAAEVARDTGSPSPTGAAAAAPPGMHRAKDAQDDDNLTAVSTQGHERNAPHHDDVPPTEFVAWPEVLSEAALATPFDVRTTNSSAANVAMDWMSGDTSFASLFPNDSDLLVSQCAETRFSLGLGGGDSGSDACLDDSRSATFACASQDGDAGFGFMDAVGDAGDIALSSAPGGLAVGVAEFMAEPEDVPMTNLAQFGNSTSSFGGGDAHHAVNQATAESPDDDVVWQQQQPPSSVAAAAPPPLSSGRTMSQRRRYDAISKTARQQSPPSSEHTSTGDERHVDTKPRLASGSSSDDGVAHRRGYRDADSSSDELSQSPPVERDEANTGNESGIAKGAERENSPLSDALKFLYTTAPPKVVLGRSDGSHSGSDNSQQDRTSPESNTSEQRLLKSRRTSRRPHAMKHSELELPPATRQSPPRTRHRHHHRATSGRHLGWSSSSSLSSRGRPLYGRDLAAHEDMTEVECYSDVEVTAESQRYGRPKYSLGDQPPGILVSDPEWLAEAKDPRFEGSELKRTNEAKEIADNALMDALHKHEAKLEAKQVAPEYMHYISAASYDSENKILLDVPMGAGKPVSAQLSTSGEAVAELLPDPDSSFFAPFVVVYRAFEPGQLRPLSPGGAPIRTITRYGSSFALEEEPRRAAAPQPAYTACPTAMITTDVPAAYARRPPRLGARNRVVERFQRQAPHGVIVLGGQHSSRTVISRSHAAELLSFHERAWRDNLNSAGDAKDELEELLAQKAARKPPRRSARPLAPAGVKLTPEERAALERERNREHARNTRLRKKAALANLKETVEKLSLRCEKADRSELERRARAAVKRACIETFFRYRARAELSAEKWAEVVCDDVELWQPITPHRNFRPAEIVGTRRLSKGVGALVEDAASLAVLFRSIGRRAPQSKGVDRAPRFVFEATIASRDQSEECIQEAFTSDVVGMHWLIRTLDATEYGLDCEITKSGMLVARFDPVTCKVKYVEFAFDVQHFAVQLQRALKLVEPQVIPNTVHDETISSRRDACVVTTATRPHVITDANAAWLELCGVESKEACVGQTLRIIQGEHTGSDQVEQLLCHVAAGLAADTVLVNYRLTGEPFLNYLRVFPLYRNDRVDAKGRPMEYLGILKDIINDVPPTKPSLQSVQGEVGVTQTLR